jgi:UDP-N-acetylmuramoyl-tripeptide--D-alanyl-D-alanine ligase
MQIEELYSLFKSYPQIVTDTRKNVKNSLFFCLSGENFNGNKFAEMALHLGAAYVIIDDQSYLKKDKRYILVPNSLKTLQELAKYHRQQFDIPVIGVTGTNGKTTTKELLSTVLSEKYEVVATQGNFNNHLGVPLSLLRINQKTEIAIIEMGANHPGEIAFLCQLAQPNYGLITNIGKAHLEGFKSLENIQKTKLALYSSVKEQKGKLFVNRDDTFLYEKAKAQEYISYGKTEKAHVNARLKQDFPFLSIEWKMKNQQAYKPIHSNLFGNYNFYNLLAAIAVATAFKVSETQIRNGLENYFPENNRSQFLKGDKNELILDAYNANPESMKLAIDNFRKDSTMNKAVVLGDMFELGDYSQTEHQTILKQLQEASFKKTILVGDEFLKFESLYPNFHFFKDTTSLSKQIDLLSLNQMRILIKGSRGVKLEVLKDALLS